MYKRFFYSIWIALFLFTVIFSPPVLPFNTIYLTALLAAAWLFMAKRRSIVKASWNMFELLLLISVYILAVISINAIVDARAELTNNRIVVVYQVFILLPMQYLCAKYVSESLRRKHYTFRKILQLIVLSGLFEALLVVLAFVSPAVRRVLLAGIVRRGGIERVYESSYILSYRGYGWADTLLDTFGYGMGLFAGLCLLCRQVGRVRYLYMVLFLFSTAVNSRTGLAIFLIAVLLWVTQQFKSRKLSRIAGVFLDVLCIDVVVTMVLDMEMFDGRTLSWISAGFESIWNFLTGKTVGYRTGSMQNSLLSSKFWQLPESLSGLLFGTGHSVFKTKEIIGISSDVGYVNYIWICGLFGTALLLSILLYWFRKGIRAAFDPELKAARVFVCLAFYVMFIKTNTLTHTAGTFLTIFLMTIRPEFPRYLIPIPYSGPGQGNAAQ